MRKIEDIFGMCNPLTIKQKKGYQYFLYWLDNKWH